MDSSFVFSELSRGSSGVLIPASLNTGYRSGQSRPTRLLISPFRPVSGRSAALLRLGGPLSTSKPKERLSGSCEQWGVSPAAVCCGLVVWGKVFHRCDGTTIGKPIGDLTIGLRDKVAVVKRDKVAVVSATKWPWISGSTREFCTSVSSARRGIRTCAGWAGSCGTGASPFHPW